MEPNEPAAVEPAEVVPATPAPPAAETPAPGSLEELRASLGMPAKPADGPAKADATPPVKPDNSEPVKAAEPVVEEAKDDSDYALRVSRLARMDRTARAERAAAEELRSQVENERKELHGAAKEAEILREARERYAKGDHAGAIKHALGLDGIPEDLYAELASSGQQPLDRAGIDALVARGVETALASRDKAAQDAAAAERAQQEEIITSFEASHIEAANALFEEKAEKSWPSLAKFIARGERQAELVTKEYIEALQASAEKGQTAEPAALFDAIEKNYAELFGSGPAKIAEPSKTIGESLKKGVTASASNGEPKEPQDRWAAAYEAKEKWITEKLREKGLK